MVREPRLKALTKAGQQYAEQVAAGKAHLAKLRTARAARIQPAPDAIHISSPPCSPSPRAAAVEAIADEPLVQQPPPSRPPSPHTVTVEEIPDEDDVNPFSYASLAFADHLGFDWAFLTIRCDVRRNPSTPGYDNSIPPGSYDEAMRRTDANEWKKTVVAELDKLKDMGVYEVAELPAGRKAIGCRWVFEFKLQEGKPPIYKGRMVAQGFSQVAGVDFTDSFAPVTKDSSVRFVAAFAAEHDMELDTMDAVRAFLNGILAEELYSRIPQGFTGAPHGKVWRLLKSIYGLKQAAIVWYRLLRKVLEDLGFSISKP